MKHCVGQLLTEIIECDTCQFLLLCKQEKDVDLEKNSVNPDNEKFCGNCRWYAEFEGVCCNGDSYNRSDFMMHNDSCEYWAEAIMNEKEIKQFKEDDGK